MDEEQRLKRINARPTTQHLDFETLVQNLFAAIASSELTSIRASKGAFLSKCGSYTSNTVAELLVLIDELDRSESDKNYLNTLAEIGFTFSIGDVKRNQKAFKRLEEVFHDYSLSETPFCLERFEI